MTGKLLGQPEQRTAETGRTYVAAKLRVFVAGEECHFVRVTAFSDSACTALLAPDDGAAVVAAGTLKMASLDTHGRQATAEHRHGGSAGADYLSAEAGPRCDAGRAAGHTTASSKAQWRRLRCRG